MKLIQILEARKNPHLNKKISTIDQLRNIAIKHGTNNIYVRFTNMHRLGINPQYSFSSLAGIYCYPIMYVINNYDSLPYVNSFPFVQVIKSSNANLWDLSKPNISTVKSNMLAAVTALYPHVSLIPIQRANTPRELYQSMIKIAQEVIYKIKLGNWYLHRANKGQLADKITNREFSIHLGSQIHRKILTKMNIDGVIDPNDDIVTSNEYNQVVFLDSSKLKQIDFIGLTSNTQDKSMVFNEREFFSKVRKNKVLSHTNETCEFILSLSNYIQGTMIPQFKRNNPDKFKDEDIGSYMDNDIIVDGGLTVPIKIIHPTQTISSKYIPCITIEDWVNSIKHELSKNTWNGITGDNYNILNFNNRFMATFQYILPFVPDNISEQLNMDDLFSLVLELDGYKTYDYTPSEKIDKNYDVSINYEYDKTKVSDVFSKYLTPHEIDDYLAASNKSKLKAKPTTKKVDDVDWGAALKDTKPTPKPKAKPTTKNDDDIDWNDPEAVKTNWDDVLK
jgi:hypothetical protein